MSLLDIAQSIKKKGLTLAKTAQTARHQFRPVNTKLF